MDWTHDLTARIAYTYLQSGLIWPVGLGALGVAAALLNRLMRKALKDGLALTGFVSLPAIWLPFGVLAVAFLDLSSPTEPFTDAPDALSWAIPGAAIASVVMGTVLLVRARGARGVAAVYIAVNAVSCAWSGVVFEMARLNAWM